MTSTRLVYFRAIAGKLEACPPLPEEAMHAAKSATESKTIATGPNFRTKTLPRLPEPSHDGSATRPSYGDQRNPSAKRDIGTGTRNSPSRNHWRRCSPEPTDHRRHRWIVKGGKIGFSMASHRAQSPRLNEPYSRVPRLWRIRPHDGLRRAQRRTSCECWPVGELWHPTTPPHKESSSNFQGRELCVARAIPMRSAENLISFPNK